MPQLAVARPLREPHFGDEIRTDPVRGLVRLDLVRERRRGDLARLQQLRHAREFLLIEAGAGVPDVHEPSLIVDAKQQGPEVLARLPRLRPASDDEFLLVEEFELSPRGGAASRLIRR